MMIQRKRFNHYLALAIEADRGAGKPNRHSPWSGPRIESPTPEPRYLRFNLWWVALLSALLVAGCKTTDSKSQLTALRVHLEVNHDSSGRNKPVPVNRDETFAVNVENEPFLTEANVKEARVIDVVGGFALRIQFDRRGTWLLEQYTAANPGRHLAIFCQFRPTPGDKATTGRWIAAPLITGRNATGVLTFTPDASRTEAYQIVLGLNNVARKNRQNED